MSKLFYPIAGTVIATVSAVTLVKSVPVTKAKAGRAAVAVGVVGLLTGLSLMAQTQPTREKKEPVTISFDEEDAKTIKANVCEVLNKPAEAEPAEREIPKQIELDEETSIEDFLG